MRLVLEKIFHTAWEDLQKMQNMSKTIKLTENANIWKAIAMY